MSLYTVQPIEIVIDHEQYLLDIENDEDGQLAFRLQYLKGGYYYEFTCFNQKEADILTEPSGITLKVQQLGNFLKRVLTSRIPSRSAFFEVFFCKEDYIDYKLFLQYGTKLPQKEAEFLIFHIVDKSLTKNQLHFMIPFKRVQHPSSIHHEQPKLFSERVHSHRHQQGDEFPDDISELSIGPFESESRHRDPEAQAAIQKLNKRVKYLEKRGDTTQRLVDQQHETISKLKKWNEKLIAQVHDQATHLEQQENHISSMKKKMHTMMKYMKNLSDKIEKVSMQRASYISDDDESLVYPPNDVFSEDDFEEPDHREFRNPKTERRQNDNIENNVDIEVIKTPKSRDLTHSFPETVILYREHWKKSLIERTKIDQWHCIYRASRDGFLARNFHSLVDHKGPSLTLIRTTHAAVFGGYSSISWRSPSFGELTHDDHHAFLFSFRRRLSGDETPIFLRSKEGGGQVRHASDALIAFGTQDLVLASGSNSGNMQSISRLSGEFHMDDGSQAPPYLLCDAQQFVVSDIEVYIPS